MYTSGASRSLAPAYMCVSYYYIHTHTDLELVIALLTLAAAYMCVSYYYMCLILLVLLLLERDRPGACHSALLHVSHIQLLLLLLDTHRPGACHSAPRAGCLLYVCLILLYVSYTTPPSPTRQRQTWSLS